MKFQIAPTLLSQLTSLVDPSHGWRGKNTFRIGVISSIPGGGKTRLLLELYNLLPGMDAVYFVDFFDRSPLLAGFDQMKDTQSAKKSIAMRILYQAIQLKSDRGQQQSFKNWLDEVNTKGLPHVDEITDAIGYLGADMDGKCVIAIDEVTQLIEDPRSDVSQDGTVTAMVHLINAIGQSIINNQRLNVFMAGTVIDKFTQSAKESDWSIELIHLNCLDYRQQSAILDNYPGISEWRLSQGIKQFLSELGGLPRLLEAFIEEVLIELERFGSLAASNFSAPSRAFYDDGRVACYSCLSDTPTLAQRLVEAIILRSPVKSGDSIIPERQDLTYESLQQYSQIILTPAEQRGKEFRPNMALLTFRQVLSRALSESKSKEDLIRLRKVELLLEHKPESDQDFKQFCADYTTVSNSFFREWQPRIYSTLLSKRYAEGYGGAGHTQTIYLAKTPEKLECIEKFPAAYPPISRKHLSVCKGERPSIWDGDIWLNAEGAEFADLWYACNNDKYQDTVICHQYKHGQHSNLTFADCVKLHKRNVHSLTTLLRDEHYDDHDDDLDDDPDDDHEKDPTCSTMKEAKDRTRTGRARLITVVITTDEVEEVPCDHRKRNNLLVIDRTKLREYFGVFAPLLLYHE